MNKRGVRRLAATLTLAAALGAVDAGIQTASAEGFFLNANFVYAWRMSGDANEPAIVPLAGPGTISRPGDLDVGPSKGLDIQVGFDGPVFGFDARFFGNLGWTGGPDQLGAVGNVRIGSFSNFGATALATSMESRLNSAEVNLRATLGPNVVVFGGMRYLTLYDAYRARITFPAFFADYEFLTTSAGLGGQLGLDSRFTLTTPAGVEIVYLNLDLRGGLLHLETTQDFTLRPSTGGQFDGGIPSTTMTVFGEAGVTVGRNIGDNFAIEAGYRVLYLPRMATGGGYIADATAQSTQSPTTTYRPFLVQAVTVGATLNF